MSLLLLIFLLQLSSVSLSIFSWKWSVWTIQRHGHSKPLGISKNPSRLWAWYEVQLKFILRSVSSSLSMSPLLSPCQRLRQAFKAWRKNTPGLVRSWVRDTWPTASSGFGDWEFFAVYTGDCYIWGKPLAPITDPYVCESANVNQVSHPSPLLPESPLQISMPSADFSVLTHQLCLPSVKILLAKKHLLIWCWTWISCNFHPRPWTFLFALWKWVEFLFHRETPSSGLSSLRLSFQVNNPRVFSSAPAPTQFPGHPLQNICGHTRVGFGSVKAKFYQCSEQSGGDSH